MNKQIIFVILALIVGFVGGMLFTTPALRNHPMMGVAGNIQNPHIGMGSQAPMTGRQMMEAMTLKLKDKSGDDFDATFIEQMIPHHQGAVEMAQLALTSSKRPEIIKLANDIIASQQKEIEQMRSWQRAWFGINPQ